MITLKDIGKFEQLPEIAMLIYKGDEMALQTAIAEAGISKRILNLASIQH